MKGWRNSADVRRRRKERPESRKQEKKKRTQRERQGLNGMKTEVMQDRKDSRTAGRKGPRETVREMKAERAAMRIGSSREGRGQTDPRARRAAGRMQEAPETTDPREDPGKGRAVPAITAVRGLVRALTVMQTAAVLAETMAALAEIATVLRENVHRVRAEGRTLSVPWTINSGSPHRARVLLPKAPLKKGRSTETKKNAAALRKEISAARKTSSMKRTAKQRTN